MKLKYKINDSINKKIDTISKKSTKDRSLIKQSNYKVEIKESNQVNPLHHENIHFKKEYSKDKRNLFLS